MRDYTKMTPAEFDKYTKELQDGTRCPACGEKFFAADRGRTFTNHKGQQVRQLTICHACGAVTGQCYLGDSYTVALPYLKDDPDRPDFRPTYFDLTTLGSAGVGRRHGWFDPSDGYMTQVG